MKFKITESRCTGCQICQLACSATKDGAFSLRQARVRVFPHGNPKPRIVVCRQCKVCKCLEACGYQAFKKEQAGGGVRIDPEVCQACLACIDACPFGAVNLDSKTNLPMVCDLCGGEPVCVTVCRTAAIQVIESASRT